MLKSVGQQPIDFSVYFVSCLHAAATLHILNILLVVEIVLNQKVKGPISLKSPTSQLEFDENFVTL